MQAREDVIGYYNWDRVAQKQRLLWQPAEDAHG